jgi:hypothetical protein
MSEDDGELVVPANEETVDALVDRINALQRASLLQFLLSVGSLIVDNLFDGDVDAWRRSGTSDVSFRQLCEHPEMDLPLSGLSRAVRVHELHRTMVSAGHHGGLADLEHLSPSHFYSVLGLPYQTQVRLLSAANDEGWSTRQLEAVARSERSGTGGRRGRRRMPRVLKTLGRFRKIVDDAGSSFADLDAIDELGIDEAMDHWQTVVRLRTQLEQVERRLKSRVARGGTGSEG